MQIGMRRAACLEHGDVLQQHEPRGKSTCDKESMF